MLNWLRKKNESELAAIYVRRSAYDEAYAKGKLTDMELAVFVSFFAEVQYDRLAQGKLPLEYAYDSAKDPFLKH